MNDHIESFPQRSSHPQMRTDGHLRMPISSISGRLNVNADFTDFFICVICEIFDKKEIYDYAT